MIRRMITSAGTAAQATAAVARSGLMGPGRPDHLARAGIEAARRGPVAGACTGAAIRWGERPALTDELGTISYIDLDRRSNSLARAFQADGLEPGDGIAILCRNHRGFADATYAAAKCGLRSIYMNTEFAGPQIEDVCKREGVKALVFDEEYDNRAPSWAEHHYRAWTDDGSPGSAQATIEDLIARFDGSPVPVPSEKPTMVMLTSGTTGTPKGAPRQEVGTLVTLGALFDRVPWRTNEVTYIAPPFFHALGYATLSLAVGLGSRVVCRRRFNAEEFLTLLESERATAAIVVPAMLQRTLELGPERIKAADTSALRIIFCGGSQLPGAVATATQDAFGEILYVLYGSTEVAYASISTPADHRAAPTTVGRTTLGTKVRLLDESGSEVPTGRTGRIFVSNGIEFGGYTDGSGKEVIDGLMSSGDVGHFDSAGRIFIDGRDDDMIVSGGENVFPQEVEELLIQHEQVDDAAVIGVDDESFGKRLRAFVVASADKSPTEDELKEYVRQNLARYKIPREVLFIDELPRNATGKVLKRELRSRPASP